MSWVYPKNWDGKKSYGIEQVPALITHFEAPLKAAGFGSRHTFKE